MYSKTLQSLCDCLHIAIYQSPNKAKQAIQVFKYELFENILDITRSKELKLTICRLLSCLLSNFEIEDKQADRLVLHLINIYKENINKEDLSAQKEAGNALTSLLFYSKSAKTVACSTGFAKDLAEYAKDALENAQITEVNKNKKSDDGAVKELIKILAIFKL